MLGVALALANADVLADGTALTEDTFGHHALLLNLGGGVVEPEGVGRGKGIPLSHLGLFLLPLPLDLLLKCPLRFPSSLWFQPSSALGWIVTVLTQLSSRPPDIHSASFQCRPNAKIVHPPLPIAFIFLKNYFYCIFSHYCLSPLHLFPPPPSIAFRTISIAFCVLNSLVT